MTLSRISKVAGGALLLGVMAVAPAQAQDQWLAVSWGGATPSGDTKSFAEGTSFRNVGIEYVNFIKPNIGVGFNASWSVFSNRVADVTTSLSGVDLHGTQIRYVNAFPLLVTGRYSLSRATRRNSVGAWVGAGVGALIGENRVDLGLFTAKETNWHLAVAPEVGVSYALSRDFALFGQGRYTYGFKTNDVSPRFFNFNVGLAWRN